MSVAALSVDSLLNGLALDVSTATTATASAVPTAVTAFPGLALLVKSVREQTIRDLDAVRLLCFLHLHSVMC